MLGLFSALMHETKTVDIWSALHLSFAALRIILLSGLALTYTKLLKRQDFVPAQQASPSQSTSYGTFSDEVDSQQQPPDAQPESQQKDTKASDTGFKAFLKRIKILSPYLWPKNSLMLQIVAGICLVLLAAGRVVNLLVPLYLGKLVSALSKGDSPWMFLGLFIALKFCQGSGGILQALQQTLWVPVSQYNDRSMTLMSFKHLLSLSMGYHTRRKTGEVLRVLDRGAAINSFFQMLIFSVLPMLLDVSKLGFTGQTDN